MEENTHGKAEAYQIIHANGLLLVNTALRSAASLITMPILNESLGSECYGLWIVITTITMYLSLAEGGLGQTVVNQIGKAYAAGQTQSINRIMSTAHVVYWLMIIFVGFIALCIINFTPFTKLILSSHDRNYDVIMKAGLSLSIVCAFSRIPFLVYPGLLMGLRRLPERISWEIFGTCLSVGSTIVAALCGAGMYLLIVINNAAMFFAVLANKFSLRNVPEWSKLRLSGFSAVLVPRLMSSSSFFFIVNLALVLDRCTATLLVPRFVSLAATPAFFFLVSLFRVAGTNAISTLPKAMQPYILLWSHVGNQGRVKLLTKLSIRATTVVAAGFVAVFIPVAELTVTKVLGKSTFPGSDVTLLICAAFLGDALSTVPHHFLVSMHKERLLAALFTVRAVITITLSLVFGSLFNNPLVGLALASALTAWISALSLLFCLGKKLGNCLCNIVWEFVLLPILFVGCTPFFSWLMTFYITKLTLIAVVSFGTFLITVILVLVTSSRNERALFNKLRTQFGEKINRN